MKRLIPLFILITIGYQSIAQNQIDALRYSQTYAGGTARSTSMAGAFGSLGGDFASVSQNPAGLGIYRSSELTFTPELFYGKVTSNYMGNSEADFKYNFNLNNFGYVSAFGKGKEGFIGGAFAFGFNRINNFNNTILIEGINTQSSLGDAFVESANIGDGNGPVGLDYLDPFTEGLFFDSWIMDFDTIGNNYYLNPAMLEDDGGRNSLQQNSLQRSGRMNEWVLSLGINYGHFLYFGGTFGVIPVYYNETSIFKELDGDNYMREYFRYYESLSVEGTGFTGKFGLIIKPVPMLRFGLAAHLPTIFYMDEEYNANLHSNFVEGTVFPIDEYGDEIDVATYDYQIVTPAKFIGSLGISLAKILIISTDFEYIDYSNMRLRNGGDGYDFNIENKTINDVYRKSFNSKSGVELRLDKLYLRGGFGFYGSPYQKDEANYDAHHFNYTGGIGFRDESVFLDLAVSYMMNSERMVLYNVSNQAQPVSTELNQNALRTMITCGFRF